jgi:acetyl-CoA acetyltransferase
MSSCRTWWLVSVSQNAWIVDALRTPVGRHRGALCGVRADDLAALVGGGVVERSGSGPSRVDDVYLGCTNGVGEDSRNVARMSVPLAGLPDEAFASQSLACVRQLGLDEDRVVLEDVEAA